MSSITTFHNRQARLLVIFDAAFGEVLLLWMCKRKLNVYCSWRKMQLKVILRNAFVFFSQEGAWLCLTAQLDRNRGSRWLLENNIFIASFLAQFTYSISCNLSESHYFLLVELWCWRLIPQSVTKWKGSLRNGSTAFFSVFQGKAWSWVNLKQLISTLLMKCPKMCNKTYFLNLMFKLKATLLHCPRIHVILAD